MVNETVSVNVPGYGPAATPVAVNVKLEVPSWSQENSEATAGVTDSVSSSPVKVAWADAADGSARQASSTQPPLRNRIQYPSLGAAGRRVESTTT
jgi:hypothetical protein